MQLNCNGVAKKIDEILALMVDRDIKIAALQETKLTAQHKQLATPGFALERQDRGTNKGGGLAFLIHHSVKYCKEELTNHDVHMEVQRIRIKTGPNTWIKITNAYIPPVSCCQTGYVPTIVNLLTEEDSLVLGDLNGSQRALALNNSRRPGRTAGRRNL